MMKTKADRKQLPVNLISNLGSLGVNIFAGIWIVPYLIGKLGVAGYGLIPLAAQITNFASLITLAVNGSVSRFLAIELKRNNILMANRIFNTAFFTLGALLVLLIPLSLLFSHFVPRLLDVPAQYVDGSELLFLCIMGTFIATTYRNNFDVSPFALNRLEIRNAIDIFNILARVGLIVLFFEFFAVGVAQVGLAYLLAVLLTLALSVFFWRQLTPQLEVRISHFHGRCMKELCSSGGWIVVNQIGALLFLGIDLIVVNSLFGASSAGSYSAILQWNSLMRMTGAAIAGAFTPIVIGYFALNQRDKIIQFSQKTVKFTGLILALPIGLLCGLSVPVLKIWLGPDFVQYAPLMCLMLFHLPVNLGILPLFNINVASNMVKTPGWVTLVMGILNAFLAVVLPLACGWGMYGVAAAGAIALTLKNSLFTSWYASRVLDVPAHTFNGAMFPCIIGTVFAAGLGFMMNAAFTLTSWWSLLLAGMSAASLYIAACWILAVNPSERKVLISMLPGFPLYEADRVEHS